MAASTTHFKVDNGDMLLVRTAAGRKVVIDVNIRSDADDPSGEAADVASQLRARLERDGSGRLYVDAFLLTHPDHDHCRGLRKHFHLGPLSTWKASDDKIVIREMWSSPIVFRRASRDHVLSEDASAWAAEARRRVAAYRHHGWLADGDRIVVLGGDINGKTDDLGGILVRTDESFQRICGAVDPGFRATLLAPIPPQADEAEEEALSKNNSSVVVNVELGDRDLSGATRYLLGGDAEVGIWERLWKRNRERPWVLQYDVLVAPHHCSWHSLSWDSWSWFGERARASPDARSALGQALPGATVVASSKPIRDDDSDPPCIRAKREYLSILSPLRGTFQCLGELPGDEPLEFDVSSAGGPVPRRRGTRSGLAAPSILGIGGAATGSSTALGSQPFKHG